MNYQIREIKNKVPIELIKKAMFYFKAIGESISVLSLDRKIPVSRQEDFEYDYRFHKIKLSGFSTFYLFIIFIFRLFIFSSLILFIIKKKKMKTFVILTGWHNSTQDIYIQSGVHKKMTYNYSQNGNVF